MGGGWTAGLAVALVSGGMATGAARAADGDFGLEYRVERAEASRLSLDQCARVVEQAASQAGYRVSIDRYPGQLAVIAGGPPQGGWSYTVYCIAVDQKVAHVVQGISYRPGGNVAGFVNRVHAALLKAARP
ncbi:DUF6180 family protein [Camelimonas sp. ID_303_24]